ncbi:F0F1 ATP synthase subunit epsilon [Pseudomonas sp. AN-1]|uniref:F0F1 ATP synthase subunit epsilon n=1 Tax=Pseudomonas sp. AN-1 TaxID=3096605 RepID=UPI002A6B53CC|nr:F0F1 ATP synthase subunit epsilon [Pseudomonas sp. AN-1]WPP44496.1 F0F1 ATP synthase subunit epsilon [Pseudomonas sp. AN-1]
MAEPLHLLIATPQRILVDLADVVALRGEDASGSFGLLPGHVDYLTVLRSSVLRWRRAGGELGFCAVRGGVLSLAGGELRVACREGILGSRLDELEARVREAREAQHDSARQARVEHLRLHTRAVRQLVRYLRAEGETPFNPEGEP